MKYSLFIGIDISKKKLDLSIFDGRKILNSFEIKNETSEIKEFFLSTLKELNIESKEVLLCAEHTSIYSNLITSVSEELNLDFWLEHPTQIKSSIGLTRGKNDQIDSKRIAEYAWRYNDKARLMAESKKSINELKFLNSERDFLVGNRAAYKAQLQDQQDFIYKDIYENKKRRYKKLIEGLDDQIQEIETVIKNIIKANPTMQRQLDILNSIDGIGNQVAINLIIQTESFTKYENARQFCCHAGVAPFEYRSGSSQRSKNKVSHKANKAIKSLLHLSAISILSMKQSEMKEYYLRKVGEGKNKMSVINAIRAKIIHRAFALVKQDRLYEKNYNFFLA